MRIDLRIDTITQPTEAMRRAMAKAEVGDDVYKEDPTVNRLEERAAEILGKDAALFVTSGTRSPYCVTQVLGMRSSWRRIPTSSTTRPGPHPP